MVDHTYAYDLDECVEPIPKPGHMEQYDRRSLDEVRNKIAQRAYRDGQEVRDHLLFLERLADKLQNKLHTEQSDGETGWSLNRDLTKVKDTFKILARLLDKLE